MSDIQTGNSHHTTEEDMRQFRWFFARLYAMALVLSIPAAVVIAILTKNPLPGLIPTPLLLSMRPMIRWAFSQPSKENPAEPAHNKIRQIRNRQTIP